MPYGRTVSPGAISSLEQAALDAKAPLASPTFSGTVTNGAGDLQSLYYSGTPQLESVKHGTAASPVTTFGPTFKVSRTEQFTRAALTAASSSGADGVDLCSALVGINKGTTSTEVQAVGVFGAAVTGSTASVSYRPDACGLYGAGRLLDGATGVGIGAFLIGRRDGDTGYANGLEVHCQNYGSAAAYITTGFTPAQGIWINCSGAADSAAGIILSNAFGKQFEVGLAFNAEVTNALTGPTRVNDIRSDSTSTTSILINGTHATAAIAVANGSGHVGIGTVAPSYKLDVVGSANAITTRVKGFSGQTADLVTLEDASAAVATVSVAGHFRSAAIGNPALPPFSHPTDTDTGYGLSGSNALYLTTGGTVRLNITSAGAQFFNSGNQFLGGGVGCVGISNATTVPTSNPTGGGILWSEGGALKWRGSSGTVTTIAAA